MRKLFLFMAAYDVQIYDLITIQTSEQKGRWEQVKDGHRWYTAAVHLDWRKKATFVAATCHEFLQIHRLLRMWIPRRITAQLMIYCFLSSCLLVKGRIHRSPLWMYYVITSQPVETLTAEVAEPIGTGLIIPHQCDRITFEHWHIEKLSRLTILQNIHSGHS